MTTQQHPKGFVGEHIGTGEHCSFDLLCEIPCTSAWWWAFSKTYAEMHAKSTNDKPTCPPLRQQHSFYRMHAKSTNDNPLWPDKTFIVVDENDGNPMAIARDGDKYFLYIDF